MNMFLKRVSLCDCLIAPMNMDYYQRNQSSSAVTEQIRFEKPAIFPGAYRVPELEDSTLYYENIDEIKSLIIENYCDPNKVEVLRRNAEKNSQKYSFKNYIFSLKEFIGK